MVTPSQAGQGSVLGTLASPGKSGQELSGATLMIFTLNVRVPFDHIPVARTSHVALPKLGTGGGSGGEGGGYRWTVR